MSKESFVVVKGFVSVNSEGIPGQLATINSEYNLFYAYMTDESCTKKMVRRPRPFQLYVHTCTIDACAM